MTKALLLIDLQNDFMPGGALAVSRGNEVIPLVNSLQRHFEHIIATQDWHPQNHGSFAINYPGRKPGEMIELNGLSQILWPAHCVQNTVGAELVTDLNPEKIQRVITKGSNPEIDSYSGFFDNGHRQATELAQYCQDKGINELYLAGVATDYCVKFTALDAVNLGFKTYLIEDACRGVNLQIDDATTAINEMCNAGVLLVNSHQIV